MVAVVDYTAKTEKIYVNGVLKSSSSGKSFGSNTSSNTSSTNSCIGAEDDCAANYFKGSIDDLRVYNRALSAAEVTNIFNGSPSSSGLVDLWDFDQTSGTTATDSGTYNGTLTNIASPSLVSSGWTTSAHIGSGAIVFDGSDDYLANIRPSNIRTTIANSTYSIALWFKTSSSSSGPIAMF